MCVHVATNDMLATTFLFFILLAYETWDAYIMEHKQHRFLIAYWYFEWIYIFFLGWSSKANGIAETCMRYIIRCLCERDVRSHDIGDVLPQQLSIICNGAITSVLRQSAWQIKKCNVIQRILLRIHYAYTDGLRREHTGTPHVRNAKGGTNAANPYRHVMPLVSPSPGDEPHLQIYIAIYCCQPLSIDIIHI